MRHLFVLLNVFMGGQNYCLFRSRSIRGCGTNATKVGLFHKCARTNIGQIRPRHFRDKREDARGVIALGKDAFRPQK